MKLRCLIQKRVSQNVITNIPEQIGEVNSRTNW